MILISYISLMESLYTVIKNHNFESKDITKKLIEAHKALAELKWVANTLPNKTILTNTLSLQEAKDSSAIENIVTTQDELYQSNAMSKQFASMAAKEVYSYAEALNFSYNVVKKNGIIMTADILKVQSIIEKNTSWLRKLPWTELKNDKTWETVYTPPQSHDEIVALMTDLEKYVNDTKTGIDPLINVALIHHQFESIHPFYDGNGRAGRILNVLYIVKEWLLETPILYLSRYVNKHKADYYRLLQMVRESGNRDERIIFMLTAIEQTAKDTIKIIENIKTSMMTHKQSIRSNLPKIYSQDLLNNIFRHPYTKIEFVMNDLRVTRITATRYLDELVKIGILAKQKIGRESYYINTALYDLLSNVSA